MFSIVALVGSLVAVLLQRFSCSDSEMSLKIGQCFM